MAFNLTSRCHFSLNPAIPLLLFVVVPPVRMFIPETRLVSVAVLQITALTSDFDFSAHSRCQFLKYPVSLCENGQIPFLKKKISRIPLLKTLYPESRQIYVGPLNIENQYIATTCLRAKQG